MSFLANISPGNVKGKLPTTNKYTNDLTWTRPTQWIDLNVPTGVPEKIIGLVAVIPEDTGHNFVALHLDTNDSSNVTINWGDGTTESLAHNTTHYHSYDYDAITTDTSTAKATLYNGYKQVKFEVTLTGTAKFSQINLDQNGPHSTYSNRLYKRGPNILDIFVSSSLATNVEVSDDRPLTICEQIEIRNTSSNRLTNPQRLYSGAKNLQSIPFVPFIYNTGSRDYYATFYACHKLTRIPDGFADPDKYWFKNPNRTQHCFYACYRLVHLPNDLFGTTEWANCNNYHRMFDECRSIKHIPHLPVRTGSGTDTRLDYVFNNCQHLKAIPQGFSIQRAQNEGIDRLFHGCQSITDYSPIIDGTTDVLGNMNNPGPPNFNMQASQMFSHNRTLTEFPFIGQFTKFNNELYHFIGGCYFIKNFNSQYTHLDFKQVDGLKQCFQDCFCMEEYPEIKVRSLTRNNALHYTFYNNLNLRKIKMTGMIAGPANGEYQRCFYNNRTLTVIDGIDFSFATETSDYYQTFHVARDITAIRFPGTFRAGYASPRINVTVANHSDISGEYHITADGTGYDQAGGGDGELRVTESGGNYTWTMIDNSDDTPSETSTAASNTQYTPWAADWSGATNAVTFTEVETGFKYTITGGSGDGLRYCPINRANMLEIFNQLVTISHSATIDIRNNPATADLTADDIAIATNKGWTVCTDENC